LWGIPDEDQASWRDDNPPSKRRIQKGLVAGLICFKPAKGLKVPERLLTRAVKGRPGWRFYLYEPLNPFLVVRMLLTTGTLYRTIWDRSVRELLRSKPITLTKLWGFPKPVIIIDSDDDEPSEYSDGFGSNQQDDLDWFR